MRKFAGQHFVLEELKKLRYEAELLPKKGNQSPETKVNDKIVQVRTRKNSIPGWILHSKAEQVDYDNYFYAFVNLDENNKPIFSIVPNKDVAISIREDHI